MQIPWTAKRTNESILNELSKKSTPKSKIRKQQANFFGHAMGARIGKPHKNSASLREKISGVNKRKDS